jgi:hypothetical protein
LLSNVRLSFSIDPVTEFKGMMGEGGGVDEDNTKSYRARIIFSLAKDKLR